jgi:hypothetical protein
VARSPALRRSIVAALECLRRFVGVRAGRVLTDAPADRSALRAVALADPFIADDGADVFATVMLIDALLSMGRQKVGFLRRYYSRCHSCVRRTVFATHPPRSWPAAARCTPWAPWSRGRRG